MPWDFFSQAAFSGRIAWFTISVVYQTTLPSFFAASISAASAHPALWLGVRRANASTMTRADRTDNPPPTNSRAWSPRDPGEGRRRQRPQWPAPVATFFAAGGRGREEWPRPPRATGQ